MFHRVINHCIAILQLKQGIPTLASTSATRLTCTVKTPYHRPASKKPFTMKVDTPEFHSLFTPGLKTLLALFSKHNYEIRMAGGAVRDILSGLVPKDVDFATTATPVEMKTMFTDEGVRMINMKGEKHGTITARIEEENFEVTTLRIDVSTDGRHAEVQFTTDWELDANRRDLTINSMFLGADGTVYDYFGGYEDLKAKKVAFVGNPVMRIQEDYLRILRYFRFFGRVSEDPEKHDPETINAIKQNVGGLASITGERIWMELSKIISGRFVHPIISKMIEVGAGPFIGLPSEPNLGALQVVCKRTEGLNPRPMTLLASLLNSEEDMSALHDRFKLSRADKTLGEFIVANRDKPANLKDFQKLMLRPDSNLPVTRQCILELLKYSANLELHDQFQKWEPPKFPINGNMLKGRVPLGNPMGRVLKALKNIWIDSDFTKTADELMEELPRVMETLKIKPA